MTSEEEDDTLPLPGLSQEPFVDVTVDEDFIPTSQPKSFPGTKMTKIPESDALDEGKDPDSTSGTELLPSVIDDTIPAESVADEFLRQHISANFIEETEIKKTEMELSSEEPMFSGKKPTGNKGSNNDLGSQLESGWEKEMSRVSESPLLETQNFSIIEESLPYEDSLNEASSKNGSSVPATNQTAMTEIIVNDSVETVDLDGSGNSPVGVEKKDTKNVDSEMTCSLNSEMERCDREETQIFDNSSALLLDQPEPSPARSDFPKTGKPFEAKTSQELYLCETIDDNELSPCQQEKIDESQFEKSLPIVAKFSNGLGEKKSSDMNVEIPKQEERTVFKEEKSSVAENQAGGSTSTPLEIRKMDFKLHITCHVTINPKTGKVIQKLILNVNEVAKPKAKRGNVELTLDNTSDKSKRYSASSSGSVYSDKTGLPFALPKRISTISDQTDASDSSEDSRLIKGIITDSKIIERIPWKNEFLLPMKMDELMMLRLENQDSNNRPISKSSPRKFKSRQPNGLNNLEEVSESLSSEQGSMSNSLLTNGNGASDLKDASEEGNGLKEVLEKADSYEVGSSSTSSPKVKGVEEIPESGVQTVEESSKETGERVDTPQGSDDQPSSSKPEGGEGGDSSKGEESKRDEEDDVQVCEGLEVFARWTDKQYYSGILAKTPKNDRWEIKFDDGTVKNIREDFVMPSKWLKVGELVFALVDDKYASGKIVRITPGEEAMYTVELDSENRQVDVKRSDLSLTEVMASIVKEKFKPLCSTPGKRTADINFDNVLSGKRLRELKTPLKPVTTDLGEISSTNKKSLRGKRDVSDIGLTKGSGKKLLKRDTESRVSGLQSENGHLVRDKAISADSSSTPEGGDTPVRNRKGGKKKTKPRTLCYEAEVYLSIRKKSKFIKEGLAPDGTPIPGPSGVKFKKQKPKGKIKAKPPTPTSDNSSSSSPTEDIRIPTRSVKYPTAAAAAPAAESKMAPVGRNSRSKRRSPGPSKNGEGVEKKGKRKFNMDCSEEATEDGPPAKTPASKKGEGGRKKTKTKKD